MNLTYGDVFNLAEILKELLELKLPTATALRVVRNVNLVNLLIKEFEDARIAILNQYKSEELPVEGKDKIVELLNTYCGRNFTEFTGDFMQCEMTPKTLFALNSYGLYEVK
jgi:hypothetical protein